jgi:hypothetical protein
MVQLVWLSHLKPQVSTLCSAYLVAQFFLPTIQFLIHQLDISWFDTNKARVTLQLDTHKCPVVLVFVSPHLARVPPTL